jgi:phosphotransferase system enzyme I (PtsI)
MMLFSGISIGYGIAQGSVVAWTPIIEPVSYRKIPDSEILSEKIRIKNALEKARKELEDIAIRVEIMIGKSAAGIFRAHKHMLEDTNFLSKIEKLICEEHWSAESAVSITVDEYLKTIASLNNPYLESRTEDLKDLQSKLLGYLGKQGHRKIPVLNNPAVLVAENMAAIDVIALDKKKLIALIMIQTGATSHAALLASTLGVPVVGSVPQLSGNIHNGDTVIVDGNHGHVVVEPTNLAIREYRTRREIFNHFRGEWSDLRDLPAVTLDGHRIKLSANIGLAEEIPRALEQGAEGIGLLRTEYFYLTHGSPPNEEEQYTFYSKIIKAMTPLTVTFRAFDLGADKVIEKEPVNELNPMLGNRGIRLLLSEKEFFKSQLRALLRASRYGPTRIMFPLITGITEYQETMKVVNEVKADLRSKQVEFDESIPFGCMVETPAAAIVPDIIASEVEFLSIGSNDLIQYTLAIDRTNPRVGNLYEPLHLAVLRMMNSIIQAAHNYNRSISLCGEMAADPIFTIILLGFGVDELSMNPWMIPAIKKIIRGLHWAEAKTIAQGVLQERRAKDVQTYLERMMEIRFPQVMSVYR